MTAVVPRLIPGAGPAGTLAALAPDNERLPLPAPPAPARQAELVYALSRLDASGRLSATTLLARLQWRTSVRLAATVVGTSVVFRPDRHGVFALDPKRKVVVPLRLRRPCRLHTGDQALLVADTRENILVVHPTAALDKIVLARHASLIGGSGDDH
ncbi:hypothetical protein [Amycolatopsis silviterrae]|uniref:AbrB/MazE/SpoVT family DNA-binding domain-containing protein n=1 Tax=Amycolatopsis silviterrae TaxID=1656914 RepID=A0ABW5HH93_9PSEU